MTDLINSLLEQHFEWVRHNENERWWIMGAWLATTGYIAKEIFLDCGSIFWIQEIGWVHGFFSLIILIMLMKHTLEVKKLLDYVDMVVRSEENKEKYRIKSLWEIIREGKAKEDGRNWEIIWDCLKRIFSFGTFVSFTNGFIILLAAGIYLDVRFIFFKGITIISLKIWSIYTCIFAVFVGIVAHFFIRWFEKRIESYYQK
jgi:hypothetical protein